MSYYFNDLMSNQLKLIDEKVQHDGLILLVFVSKNCQSGPLSSFAQHSRSDKVAYFYLLKRLLWALWFCYDLSLKIYIRDRFLIL